MSATVTIDSASFARAAQRLIATSKKSASDLMRDQARLLVVDVAKITPPNKNYKWNRKGGEQTIRTDLARLFRGSTAKGSATNLAAIHREARNRFGRVPRSTSQVAARGLASYRKTVLAKVGMMAAGWNSAASKFGAKLPAWITRHNVSGSASLRVQGARVEAEITNASVYARAAAGITRRLTHALKRRSGAINRQVNHFLKQNARSAGFLMAAACLLPAAH
jgi:hypothetical protein